MANVLDIPDQPDGIADDSNDLPEYKFRAQYALKMLVDLLEVAKPEGINMWRTVGVEGVHLSPCALEVRAGQDRVLLRVTSGGAPGLDTDPASFADYVIPDDLAALNAAQR